MPGTRTCACAGTRLSSRQILPGHVTPPGYTELAGLCCFLIAPGDFQIVFVQDFPGDFHMGTCPVGQGYALLTGVISLDNHQHCYNFVTSTAVFHVTVDLGGGRPIVGCHKVLGKTLKVHVTVIWKG